MLPLRPAMTIKNCTILYHFRFIIGKGNHSYLALIKEEPIWNWLGINSKRNQPFHPLALLKPKLYYLDQNVVTIEQSQK